MLCDRCCTCRGLHGGGAGSGFSLEGGMDATVLDDANNQLLFPFKEIGEDFIFLKKRSSEDTRS
jgi:hypothetical protein